MTKDEKAKCGRMRVSISHDGCRNAERVMLANADEEEKLTLKP